MAGGPTADGLVNWLIYLIVGLVTIVTSAVQKHLFGRIKNLEDKCEANNEAMHTIKLSIQDRFSEHEKDERERDDRNQLEVKKDFRDLNQKVEEGHREILERISELK